MQIYPSLEGASFQMTFRTIYALALSIDLDDRQGYQKCIFQYLFLRARAVFHPFDVYLTELIIVVVCKKNLMAR
jgi:hypothetical protein